MDTVEFKKQSIELVREIWRVFIVDREAEDIIATFEKTPENIVVIGTGRHEFYRNREEYINGLSNDQLEGNEINFEIVDEWYEAEIISDDVCVVYGSIWFREAKRPGKTVLVDMEGSRFTVVCKRTGEDIRFHSVHHSMPYMEQMDDEYYPKRLSSIANEAVKKNESLERRVQLDHMTELYNRIYLERHVSDELSEKSGYFFLIDLDDFKVINDTKGHPAGDEVIIEFANILRRVFSSEALIGRMGGDEFAVWDCNITNEEEVNGIFDAISQSCELLSEKMDVKVSSSVGVAYSIKDTERFEDIYKRCDIALYRSKSKGKKAYTFSDEDVRMGRRETD